MNIAVVGWGLVQGRGALTVDPTYLTDCNIVSRIFVTPPSAYSEFSGI